MKKVIVLLLALSMLLTLCACAAKDDGKFTVGSIDDICDIELYGKHYDEAHMNQPSDVEMGPVFFNLSAALLSLDRGAISALSLSKSAAEYIVAQNEKYAIDQPEWLGQSSKGHSFSMMTSDKNTELHGILDDAIKQLKANGTLDRLIAEDLHAFITTDPTPVELPVFEGAKTYKIAVTGDLPPMDFVTSDGRAAGFNVALLTEIANLKQVNFELVTVDTGARTTALASGKVDAVFWTITYSCQVCGEFITATPEGTMMTESYFSDYVAYIVPKSE